MNRTVASAAASIVLAVSALGVASTSQAVTVGYEGCTPGYWKNHLDSWSWGEGDSPRITSSSPVSKIYSSAPANVASRTLQQAIQGGGGSGVDGAAVILARAAVAAWVNAAHDGIDYPWRRNGTGLDGRPALVSTVNAAFASGDRDTMLALASRLDKDNNLGCPLN